jgi:phosphoribosylformylglycinamidine synthase
MQISVLFTDYNYFCKDNHSMTDSCHTFYKYRKTDFMDKRSISIFDGNNSAGMEQTLDYVTRQTGRKLNRLEESIISLLHNNCTNQLSHRFTIDEENDLLAGETDGQAGIIGLTEDYACAFKTEPVYAESAKEIAGKVAAASGKIYREMSVCGSQPLAAFLSLSSDIPATASAQADLQRAVSDMASYGNTYGIPVAGGDMRFNNSESRGIAANLLTIGLIDKETVPVSFCQGADNPVYLVGAPDAGKQIASSAFTARSLYELICDLHDEGAIVAIQDIDDGGIAGACANMVANGTNGIELDTEIFTEEQELTEFIPGRVVMILKKEYGKKLEKACRKWNMRCMQVGAVTGEHKLKVVKGRTSLADLPASVLSMFYGALPGRNIESAPVAADGVSSTEVPVPDEHREVARFLVTCPNLQSQQWIFEQFDSTVGTNNLSTNFISDAPVIQIKGARHALAVSFCQNATDIAKYPGSASLAVAESLRRAVCTGGIPYALTGCLNYSGDVDEKILNQVNEHIELFCRKTGVSSSGIAMNRVIDGKSTIANLSAGTIAFLNDKHQHMTMSFKGKGDMIYMLGKSVNSLDSSEYVRNWHDIRDTPPQHIDMDAEAKLLRVAQKVIARKLVKSAHSVSKGGLFMALLESAMVRSFGFDITVDDEIRKDAFLFGESPSRISVSVAMARETDFIDFMMEAEVPFLTLGHITREEIRIDDNSYGFISDYRKKYFRQ